MKNLKYVLLFVFLGLVSMDPVHASSTCTYKFGNDYTILCTTKDSSQTVGCVVSEKNNNYTVGTLDNYVAYSDFNDSNGCAEEISVIVKAETYQIDGETKNRLTIKNVVSSSSYASKCNNGSCNTLELTEGEKTRGEGFGNGGGGFGGTRGEVDATSTACAYRSDDYTIECNVTDADRKVSCNLTNKSSSFKEASSLTMDFSYEDFNIGNSRCAEEIYVAISSDSTIMGASSSSSSSICNSYSCRSLNKNYQFNTGTSAQRGYLNDQEYVAAKEDADKYCDEADSENNDSAKCAEAKAKMEEIKAKYEGASGNDFNSNLDLEHFCTGPVQGVFTTLGWVFFIIKILVPVLLIIFGSIDFGKAIIASKDDEIKKSAISLAKRAVVGILIFFIPTILNLIVSLIDSPSGNTGVYKGTFWDCTRCMLDPNDSTCSTLITK